jgi:hypothetical protein
LKAPWHRLSHEPDLIPDPTAIAIMENDLLGIPPEPGTPAALAIALRRTGTCTTHQVIETTGLSDRFPVGLCTRCGKHMVEDPSGTWHVA